MCPVSDLRPTLRVGSESVDYLPPDHFSESTFIDDRPRCRWGSCPLTSPRVAELCVMVRVSRGSPQDPYRRVALITSVLIDVGKQVANRNAKGACEIVDPLEGDAAAPVFDLDQIVPAHPCFQRQTLLRQIFSQPKRPDLTADRLSIQRPPLVAVGIICGCWRCRHQTSDCEWRLKVCTVNAT